MTTSEKENISLSKIMSALFLKGYFPFVPISEYNLPFDLLVASKTGRVIRIQAKYSATGVLYKGTIRHGKMKAYSSDDFDYYGVYLPTVDEVVFPSISFRGKKLATTIRKSANGFYWYKDFLDFTDSATKRTCKEFGQDVGWKNCKYPERNSHRRNPKPQKEELAVLLWKFSMTKLAKQYGVSDSCINKWAREMGLSKPPLGYWKAKNKNKSQEA
jgi:hypothetical protein